MSLRMMALGALMVSLPVVVELPDSTEDDGGETRVTVLGAAGRYAIIDRGCEGQVLRRHPAHFSEAGASIDHRFANGLVLGARAGTVKDHRGYHSTTYDPTTYQNRDTVIVLESSQSYVNPFVAIEEKGVGLGAGWVASNREVAQVTDLGGEVSFHVRLGRPDRVYFKVSHLDGVPRWTGGNVLEMGFGGRPHPRLDFYAGLSGGGLFDGPGLGIKADVRVAPHWLLATRARLGHSGGAGQNAIAIGLTYSSRNTPMPPGGRPPEAPLGVADSSGP